MMQHLGQFKCAAMRDDMHTALKFSAASDQSGMMHGGSASSSNRVLQERHSLARKAQQPVTP